MLGIFLAIIVLSIIVAVALRFIFPQRFTNTETFLTMGGAILAGGLMLLIVSYGNTHDFDVLNGQVTGKEMERVSCSHSYSCHCHMVSSGSGKNRTSHEECDTCYRHSFDQDWVVHSSVGDFDIERIDDQGLGQPKRWTEVLKGDPTSRTEWVTNYVLASPDSLFNTKEQTADAATYGKWLPNYNKIYDYYKFDHVMNMGTKADTDAYNKSLASILRILGPAKQANVIVVFVPTADRGYKDALERHWLGGKKNDIIVTIGITDYPKIAWADAFTFGKTSGNELLAIKIRQDIETVGDVSKVGDVVGSINLNSAKYFTREHMKKYEYLENDYVPSGWALLACFIVYGIILIGLVIFFWINDVRTGIDSFNGSPSVRPYRR
jgi:hypothetical protein